jgi:predicted O-methyltransferase YrrM
MLSKLTRHLRRGTLGEALNARLGRESVAARVRWYGAATPEDGAEALAQRAQWLVDRAGGGSAWVLVSGAREALAAGLLRRLQRRGIPFKQEAPAALAGHAGGKGLAAVLCSSTQMRDITEAGRAVAFNPALAEVPFEYVVGLDTAQASFKRLDEYSNTFFVAPQLVEPFSVYGIYEESLLRFEQKCGLRDYLDLAQAVAQVVRAGVPGDVAEFGSFRGHSGWLLARLLQAHGSDKRLYLFDAFEKFPEEHLGVDYFWNQTPHDVDYEEVKAKFKDFPQVSLVKGDFTRTLTTSGIERLALAYVDCDSLRATRYLLDTIYDRLLAPGGLIVVEDYGHPALLGSRLAVHEAMRARPGALQFFSQFSGLYLIHKSA